MVTLYDRIITLCESRGIKGGKMCTDIGISKGLLTDLKKGRRTGVSAVTALKIAEYFGMTVDELYGREPLQNEEKPTIQEDDELREDIQMFTAFLQDCSEDETKALFAMSQAFLANLRQGSSAPKEEDS